MARDEPYDLMPHREIIELKKQLQELKNKKTSSQELTNSMHALTNSMDSMLKLFTETAEELKLDEKENSVNKKLDEIIEQNKVIADGMVTVSDMVKDFVGKQKNPEIDQIPKPNFPQPIPEPSFDQPPKFDPELDKLEPLDQPLPPPGSVAMPSMPFSDLEEPKHKRKGLFGRFKK